jgi:hypothetical protein
MYRDSQAWPALAKKSTFLLQDWQMLRRRRPRPQLSEAPTTLTDFFDFLRAAHAVADEEVRAQEH